MDEYTETILFDLAYGPERLGTCSTKIAGKPFSEKLRIAVDVVQRPETVHCIMRHIVDNNKTALLTK